MFHRRSLAKQAASRADGGAAVTDDAMLTVHLRDQDMSLRDIAGRLVIATGKKGEHPSPATVMRMLREHDEQAEAAQYAGDDFSFRPVPARAAGPGNGTDPALMERLQSQERPQ